MNQKKINRAKRVKKKLHNRRMAKQQEEKKQRTIDRLAYQTRQRITPAVNDSDSILTRNYKVLLEKLAEHEALKTFQSESKEDADATFAKLKAERDKILAQGIQIKAVEEPTA